MSTIRNPHDRFFKEVFTRPEVARDFVLHYLPAPVVRLLEPATLRLRKDTFVDPALQEHFSDLLYTVHLQEGQEAYIYLLFEHKSYPDPLVAFQLLRYLVRIWEHDLRQHAQQLLRPILPLVLYHGRTAWHVAPTFGALLSAPNPLRPYLPDFHFHVADLSSYPDEEIKGTVRLQVALLVLKHIFQADLAERLPAILALTRELAGHETGLEFLETLLRYLSLAAEQVSEADLAQAVLTTLGDEGGVFVATLAEKWIEQGLQQGLERGHQRGIRESILATLEIRFGSVPQQVAARLEGITDTVRLEALRRYALTVDALAAFERLLDDER